MSSAPDEPSSRQGLGDLVRRARDRLRDAGIDTAALDARVLVTAAAGVDVSKAVLDPEFRPDAAACQRIAEFVERRSAGEPVGRILGRREFWGLDFALSADTLEPRPDTERLVEVALDWCDANGGRDRAFRFADIGTGSGAIAVALLSMLPNAVALAVDLAPGALATARGNAGRHGVGSRFLAVEGNLADMVAPGIDFLVSNPPYVSLGEADTLADEVLRHDPALALFAGANGLDAYAALLPEAHRALGRFAPLFLEIGAAQAGTVGELARQSGFEEVDIYQDLGGRDRVLRARCVAK